MRRLLSVFIAVCLVLSLLTGIFVSMPSARADITEGDYTYTVAGSNATITGYAGLGGAIVIPATLGGYPVTNIGDMAFYNCTALTSVTIPNSVTTIGTQAFQDCRALTSVTIPNSVTSIGDSAFYGCSSLTGVTIPDSVTSIGDYAFSSCTALTTFTVEAGNSSYSSGTDGVLFNKATTSLVQYPGGKQGAYVIPNSITSIGNYAFQACTGLTSVTIPNSVTTIGDWAFYNCTALTSVTIGSGVISIGNHAFDNCTALTSVTIPNSVTTIGDYAFCYCTTLTSVTIGSGVISIGNNAFYGCTTLTSVTIPNSVTSIGDMAFLGCSGLTSIAVDAGNSSYSSSTDGVLFNKTATSLVAYPVGKQGAYVIPNSITSIGNYAFQGCTGLTSVTIPTSVNSIGSQAFYGCTTLTSVTIPNSVTSIDIYAFQGCTGLIAAHFSGNAPRMRASVFDSCAPGFTVWYISGANGWTNPWYGYPTATKTPKTVVVLQIGKSTFTVNGARKTLDSLPVIKNGRTLVPIRAIIEALAGTVGWDATTKKATVTLGKKTIALWIGKSAATVNGVSTPIDSTNAKVVPEIIGGRTMLPLRFVTENLGCAVAWAAATKTITITYTP